MINQLIVSGLKSINAYEYHTSCISFTQLAVWNHCPYRGSTTETLNVITPQIHFWMADIYTPHLSPAEGLWSGLSSDRTHWREQVQHLRFSGVAQQEEAHVCGTERQRQANEGEEDTEEKHSHSLPAHCGTTTVIEHISHERALQTAG